MPTCQHRVRRGLARMAFHQVLQQRLGLREIAAHQAVHQPSRAQEQRVRRQRAHGQAVHARRFVGHHLLRDLRHQLRHQLVPALEQGVHISPHAAGPQHLPALQFAQLGRQANALAAHIEVAAEQERGAQQLTQAWQFQRHVAHGGGAQARQHAQAGVAGQGIDDVADHGVAQRVVLGVGRQGHEGHHGHGGAKVCRHRRQRTRGFGAACAHRPGQVGV